MNSWARKLLTGGRQALRQRRGVVAVEFAFVAPVLALSLISVYDLGAALQQYIRLREAVRAGALYAQYFHDSVADIQSAVTLAVPDWTNVPAPTVNVYCECRVTATNVAVSGVNPYSCTADCPLTTQTNQGFVSITATRPYSAMFLTGITSTSVTNVTRWR